MTINAAALTPRVTIVIVNWNKRDYVIKLLDSLQQITYDNHTIVLVDNASTDGSVDAINAHPLAVTLLENQENLGGTGGFNTGLSYAVETLSQDYIWMLDNDAEVLPETLSELIRVMEEDQTVGIAGSCIMSPEDHDLIVEAGAFVGWDNGTSMPHLRYQRIADYASERIVDVDSVAACSALVRDAVVRKVGVMDDRYFLHWDDIDYCIRIKRAGYRVVAVMDSPAYHVAEKGYSPATTYYNFRNALLFLAKYRHDAGLAIAQQKIVGTYMTLASYLNLLGHRDTASYVSAALKDYLAGRFGKASVPSGSLAIPNAIEESVFREMAAHWRAVLIFAVGSFEEVADAIRRLREINPHLSITVAVSSDRAAVYRLPEVNGIITFDIFSSGIAAKLWTAVSVLAGGFNCGITAGSLLPPYAFILPRNCYFLSRNSSFSETVASRSSFWKVIAAFIGGKLMALRFAVPLWVCARRLRG